jgi:hypothetical protein
MSAITSDDDAEREERAVMFVHAGVHLYGKVDQVPGLLHVATEFVHLEFIPLVPLRSFVFLEGNIERIPVALSGKSVFFGYLRAALVLGAVALLLTALVSVANGLGVRENSAIVFWTTLAAAFVCVVVCCASYPLSRADPLRAWRVAMSAGLPIGLLAEHYARALSPEELDELTRMAALSSELSVTPAEGYE